MNPPATKDPVNQGLKTVLLTQNHLDFTPSTPVFSPRNDTTSALISRTSTKTNRYSGARKDSHSTKHNNTNAKIQEGISVFLSNFSDKYSIVVGLAWYDVFQQYDTTGMVIQLFWVCFVMVVINLLRYLMDTKSLIIPIRSQLSPNTPGIGEDIRSILSAMLSNLSNALLVVEIKIMSSLITHLIDREYHNLNAGVIVVLFMVPFIALKAVPFVIYWGSGFSGYLHQVREIYLSAERTNNISSIEISPGGQNRMYTFIPYLSDFVANFSEKYSLLLALDLYQYSENFGDFDRLKWFSIAMVSLLLLCLLRAMLRTLMFKVHLEQFLLWEFLDSVVNYLVQLFVVLEIKYFGSKICDSTKDQFGGMMWYGLVTGLWVPILSVRTLLGSKNNSDVYLLDGVVTLLDAFLSKYILVISFDLYADIYAKSPGSNLEYLFLGMIANVILYMAQISLKSVSDLGLFRFRSLWVFGVDIFTYLTQVSALLSLKWFSDIVQLSATQSQVTFFSLVFFGFPLVFAHLMPLVANLVLSQA